MSLSASTEITCQRLLTGDTPSGRLHLGHWLGSLENRVLMQDDYDCYFLLANYHAFITKPEQAINKRESVLSIALDYLAAGIDPKKSHIVVESEVPAIPELATLFSMLVPFPRLLRNPTIKDEIRDKKLGDNYSFGFLLYPLLQVADILALRAQIVPVGEDQIPHLELTREVARRFNQMYCDVDPHLEDHHHLEAGGLFPIPEAKLGRERRLIGLGPPAADGRLLKMSKSLNNSILLSDDSDAVARKIMRMYTDPKRLRATDPGTVEGNPLWIFHDAFNPDTSWVEQAKEQYRAGTIGDVACKKVLIEAIEQLLIPMRERRAQYASDPQQVLDIIRQGSAQANLVAEKTLHLVKQKIKQQY